MKQLSILFGSILYITTAYTQGGVGISSNGNAPNTSAMLDVQATNKGVLMPRIALTSTTDATSITNGNVVSMLVYNTATIADIIPGYYYWNGTNWVTLGGSTGSDAQNISGSSFNATTGDLVIGIQNGTSETINFNSLKDHDWYEVSGTTAPDNISDNLFTLGNVAIGIIAPDSSAVLDISSTTKGALFPRMTEIQKNAIATPATGLLVYQLDSTNGFYYFDGAAWLFLGAGSSSSATTIQSLVYTTNGF